MEALNIAYDKSVELLEKCSTPHGFVASAEDITNYKRVWTRDGVICGLAALASGKGSLIDTFKKTLETLASAQHPAGFMPSNVYYKNGEAVVSYGGLAGRVDAVTWFIIGVCQYANYTGEKLFFTRQKDVVQKCINLLDAWEFNGKHLLYVPLSGNWADEFITDGYVLYDQLLRLWALRCYYQFVPSETLATKIQEIKRQIEINFTATKKGEKYHEKAFTEAAIEHYMPCSFNPSGYRKQFDAFANSLALLLDVGSEGFKKKILRHAHITQKEVPLNLIPAFWPPVKEWDKEWDLLVNNCKYEFRNYPYEFHNGGSWPMVNGFYGLALLSMDEAAKATETLHAINYANGLKEYGFYENFNSKSSVPNGVRYCAWSAAGAVLLHRSLHAGFKLLM